MGCAGLAGLPALDVPSDGPPEVPPDVPPDPRCPGSDVPLATVPARAAGRASPAVLAPLAGFAPSPPGLLLRGLPVEAEPPVGPDSDSDSDSDWASGRVFGAEGVGGVSVGPFVPAASEAEGPEPLVAAWVSAAEASCAGRSDSSASPGSDSAADGVAAPPAALARVARASRLVPGSVAGPALLSATVSVTASVDTTSPGTQPPRTSGRTTLLAPRDAPVPRRTGWRQCIRHPFRTRP
ncbi:hypothetical protein GCM10010191_72210 [Actinomadura vinacea]|uniref:Uncharacterized protein n=1 Tax=Actinomadura vinacea TaxID=115336 RepID=A0ABN3K2K0_9ACTN